MQMVYSTLPRTCVWSASLAMVSLIFFFDEVSFIQKYL